MTKFNLKDIIEFQEVKKDYNKTYVKSVRFQKKLKEEVEFLTSLLSSDKTKNSIGKTLLEDSQLLLKSGFAEFISIFEFCTSKEKLDSKQIKLYRLLKTLKETFLVCAQSIEDKKIAETRYAEKSQFFNSTIKKNCSGKKFTIAKNIINMDTFNTEDPEIILKALIFCGT